VTDHSLRYLANCSLLFTELPLLERAAAARDAGFDAVEFWWPFPTATPEPSQVNAFVASINDAGVQLVGLNFFAGDLAGPDLGVASIPSRSSEFRDSVDIAVGIGARLGVSGFNALYGVRLDEFSAVEQDETAVENLGYAAKAADGIGATVLIEGVSGPKPYPLRTAAQAIHVVDAVRSTGASNVGFLCDLYHLAVNGDDVAAVIDSHSADIAHVQIADAPGRGEPGSGELPLADWLADLQARGYAGWVGLEYKPTAGDTPASLAWLPPARRGAVTGRGVQS
jgi:hydroxypyruvate isomerase